MSTAGREAYIVGLGRCCVETVPNPGFGPQDGKARRQVSRWLSCSKRQLDKRIAIGGARKCICMISRDPEQHSVGVCSRHFRRVRPIT